jgi:hypothetical protein
MSTYRPDWGLPDTDDLSGAQSAQNADGAAEADPEDGSSGYRDVYAWVADWALPTLGTTSPTGGRRWCAQWHHHPEAILRLTLAWQTWERARHDPTAYASWLLQTWDPMWAALTAPDGPFASCRPSRHDGGAEASGSEGEPFATTVE